MYLFCLLFLVAESVFFPDSINFRAANKYGWIQQDRNSELYPQSYIPESVRLVGEGFAREESDGRSPGSTIFQVLGPDKPSLWVLKANKQHCSYKLVLCHSIGKRTFQMEKTDLSIKQKQKKGFDNGRKFGDYTYKGLTVKKHTYLSSNHFRCLKYDKECYLT